MADDRTDRVRLRQEHAHGHPAAADLSDPDLLRELEHLHATRHETFLHAATQALVAHSERQRALEDEYLRRHPDRDIDTARLRSGARHRDGQADETDR